MAVLNLIQQQAEHIRQLEEENGWLRDEIARLKAGQARPKTKPNKPGSPSGSDHSFESRPEEHPQRSFQGKTVPIDRTARCPVDPGTRPEDAEYKGIETAMIQDVIFRRDNGPSEQEKF